MLGTGKRQHSSGWLSADSHSALGRVKSSFVTVVAPDADGGAGEHKADVAWDG